MYNTAFYKMGDNGKRETKGGGGRWVGGVARAI